MVFEMASPLLWTVDAGWLDPWEAEIVHLADFLIDKLPAANPATVGPRTRGSFPWSDMPIYE